jgi:anthranilate phosphoribosyltransferase
MNDLKPLLSKLATGFPLGEQEAKLAFDIVMSGGATPSQIGALCMGMRVRGETVDEIAGAAKSMREKALKMEAPEGSVDTAGTGGDGIGTYNVSTAAAIVIAACGVPVAKHGNKAISSKTGSADVLSALGVNINAPMELIRECLWSHNIGFFMAPRHHGAMKHVGPTRTELGTRTIFNLLGPLSNPTSTKRQLVGVFDQKWCMPLAEVFGKLGAKHVWVVHGMDGMDELTISGPSFVACYNEGELTNFEVTPEDANLKQTNIQDIRGGDAETNSREIVALLSGKPGAYQDIVVLNAAATLIVGGKVESLAEGAELALEAIHCGRAQQTLENLIETSNRKLVEAK